jgi:hypothetical protein
MSRSAFAEKLFPFISTLEKIFLVGFIIGAGLRITHTKGSDEILMVSMSGLAAICFLTAYKPPAENLGNDIKALFVTIVNKVLYISSAVCIIGLLFFFLHFEGYKQMLMIGSMSVGACMVISLYLITQLKESQSVLQPALFRALPLGIAAGFVLFYFDLP